MSKKRYVVEDFEEEVESESDFVHETKKRYDEAMQRIEKGEYPEYNKQLIREFAGFLLSRRQLKYCRVGDHTTRINKVFNKLLPKRADEVIEEEMEIAVGKINRSRWSEWTKVNYLTTIKLFWGWMEFKGKVKTNVASFITINNPKSNNLSPNDLYTKDEVKVMRDAAGCFRDRAMVNVLYDSGARIGEFLRLKIKDVYFDKYGAKLTVFNKKTEKTRHVRIINSVKDLKNWLEFHPHKDDREAYLWVKVGEPGLGNPMNYDTAAKQLKKLAKRAGIEKRVTPHLFRHSRATELASKLNEYNMCMFFGWEIGSDMPRTYIHLSGKDVEDAILEFHGLKVEEEESNDSPIQCPKCHVANPHEALFCMNCAATLKEDSAEKLIISETSANLEDNPTLNKVYEQMFMQWVKQNPDLVDKIKQQMEG